MLIRNLTKNTIKLGYGKDRVAIAPLQVINIDECKYPAATIKKYYGPYIQILTEKVEEKAHDAKVLETTDKNLDDKGVKEDAPSAHQDGQAGTTDTEGEGQVPPVVDGADGGSGEDGDVNTGDADEEGGEAVTDIDKDNEKTADKTDEATAETKEKKTAGKKTKANKKH